MQANSGDPHILWHLIWVCTVCLCVTKRTLGIYGLKKGIILLSHKSSRNLGSRFLKNLPYESALGTSDLSKFINMKLL